MTVNIIENKELNIFLQNEKDKVISFLRKKYSISDEDCNDVYQDASMALYYNIVNEKLKNLTSTLSTYFLKICMNQAKAHLAKQSKLIPLISDRITYNDEGFLDDKLDELFSLATSEEDEEYRTKADKIVDDIILTLPDTCKKIFDGYYWQNLKTTVIAEIFGYANANTVKAQKYKCVDKFKKRYNDLKEK